MNQYTYEESIKLLLNLLDNAESILSIINLSDISIIKYNKLKKITFDKLNLKYFPLVKKKNDINVYNNIEVDPITIKLFYQSLKKSMFIKFLMNYINNQNVNDLKCDLNDIFNFNIQNVCNQKLEQIEFDLNIQEKKMENLFDKCNELFHNKNDFNFNNNNNNFQFKTFNNNNNNIENINNNNINLNKSLNLNHRKNIFNNNNNNLNKNINNILKPSEEFHKNFQDAMKFVSNIELKINEE